MGQRPELESSQLSHLEQPTDVLGSSASALWNEGPLLYVLALFLIAVTKYMASATYGRVWLHSQIKDTVSPEGDRG